MTDNMTGPELFDCSMGHITDAMEQCNEPVTRTDYLRIAQIHATHAQTAVIALFAGLFADAHDMRSRELQVWNEVIPAPPLVECWGKEARRPACEERHTEDCDYAEPPPQPVKREPTGPRVYVQLGNGMQGHIVSTHAGSDGTCWVGVYWYAPGRGETSVLMGALTIIAESDVERCENGQTRDECESGENQCELCRQAEDEEGDEIERSMGLR